MEIRHNLYCSSNEKGIVIKIIFCFIKFLRGGCTTGCNQKDLLNYFIKVKVAYNMKKRLQLVLIGLLVLSCNNKNRTETKTV